MDMTYKCPECRKDIFNCGIDNIKLSINTYVDKLTIHARCINCYQNIEVEIEFYDINIFRGE